MPIDSAIIKDYEELFTPQMFEEIEKQLNSQELDEISNQKDQFLSLLSFEPFYQHSKTKLN